MKLSFVLDVEHHVAKAPFEFEFAAALLKPALAVSNLTITSSTTGSSVGAVRAVVSPVPAWISSLQDAVLRSDFTAFSNAGSITESEMAKAMTDLSAELKSSGSTLSAAQVADLKSISGNIASMGATAYLQFVTNALVNGNAANATWTGGAAKSVALGNLAAGYTATQLSELTGKWFLGTDLPSSKVAMSGSPTFSVTYSTVTAPLYGVAGPVMSDINQGYLGDCYLLSALAEVANQQSAAIKSMIVDNGNNTYGVRFFVNGTAEYVTVDQALADGGTEFNSGSAIWASLVEQAYAEFQAQGVETGNNVNYGNSFSTIGNGGAPENALEEITGASAITDFSAARSNWTSYVYNGPAISNSSLGQATIKSGLSTASVLSTLAADLLVGDDVILSSYTDATDSKGKTTLVSDHAMSIYGYDATTGMLEVRNPWGAMSGQYWDTTFEVSLTTLLPAGDTLTADNMGLATTVAAASVVAASALQAMSQITSFSVSDSVANVTAGLAGLDADSKISGLSVTGTAGADTLNLTGFNASAQISLGGDSDAAAISGFKATGAGAGTATSLNLGKSAYDMLTMGTGTETLSLSLGAATGVEYVAGFNAAYDLLSISLSGAAVEQTLVNGGDWISSSADLTHGVFLAGVSSLQKTTSSAATTLVA